MDDDATLLRRYAQTRDEAAFAALVRRHIDFVYSVARRRTHGDAHLARDVSQQVFLALARRAAALARHPSLLGWLHTCTCQRAADLVRFEARRRARETVAATDAALAPEPPIPWETLAPELDLALQTLTAHDREVVLLRHFANQSFAAIAARLHTTEAAAQMRAARALEKLRRALAKRSVTSTASALGLALGTNAVTAAPASVAAATLASSSTAVVAATATATVTGVAGTGLNLLSTMTTSTKLSLGVTAAVLTTAGIGWGVYHARTAVAPSATSLQSTAAPTPASIVNSASVSVSTTAAAATERPASKLVAAPTLADALALTDAFKRKLALSSLGHDTAATNSKRALELLAQIEDPADRASFIEGMMAAAAKMPPIDAVSLAAALPSGSDQDAGLRALAGNWGVNFNDPGTQQILRMAPDVKSGAGVVVALTDPERAIAWAEGLLDGDMRRAVIANGIYALARKDLQTARNYAATVTDSKDRQFINGHIATAWAESDPDAALRWAKTLPDDLSRRTAEFNVIVSSASRDLGKATQLALSLTAGIAPSALTSISNGIIQRRGPTEAKAWASTLPEGPAKQAVLQHIAANADGIHVLNSDGSTEILPTIKTAK